MVLRIGVNNSNDQQDVKRIVDQGFLPVGGFIFSLIVKSENKRKNN